MRLPLRPLIAATLFLFPPGAPVSAADNALNRDIDPELASRIVNAIYRVEGGRRAKVPFGILSVRVSSFEEARRVCRNTVVNNHRRWHDAGRPGHYLDFLADQYCPKIADLLGNTRWKKNVRAALSLSAKTGDKPGRILTIWDYG